MGSEEDLDTVFDCQRSGLPYPPKKGQDDVPVLICLAGFPDTAAVWSPLVNDAKLQRSHHIIALGLPGLQLDELPADHKWGYTNDEIQQELHKVVLYCHRLHPNNKAAIHLLAHDWGAAYCYLYVEEHASQINKYAALDVGLLKVPELPITNILRVLAYFWWLAAVFVVHNLVSKYWASRLIKIYPWGAIGPLFNDENYLVVAPAAKSPHGTYPYYQLLKTQLTSLKVNPRRVSITGIKQIQQCFLYGTKKKAMYHSEIFLERLSQMPGCFSMSFEGGHWFYTQPELSSKVADVLYNFFLESNK